jgi:steroid delta-isomerase-like uncharacterized protein
MRVRRSARTSSSTAISNGSTRTALHGTVGSVTSNADLIRDLHEALLSERDIAVVDRFFADDFVSHNNPPGFPPGVDGVKQFFAMFRDAFPDAAVAIDELVADGDQVAVATTLTGTHTGELMGIAPSGRSVSVTGIDIVRIEDGRIAEHRGLTDIVGLMRQLTA